MANTTTRISQDKYFMKIATIISQRSTCIKRKVGAVLVKDSHIISTGYNGVPSGFEHCTIESCVRRNLKSGAKHEFCKGVHAEINCIIQAALHGTSILGDTTLYTTTFPCTSCLKLLINSKIKRIVYMDDYDMNNKIKSELLSESKILIQKISNLFK
ncbi:MAG: cytidine deaminase [Candidatus Lokiarchaeota archaeon]|nr:cytidine deaminase [Candidatus Lokiarchaeota archaeon]MBD3199680.1 cytidine deaminase [Candidatus Lokiarchaeota archaeon]